MMTFTNRSLPTAAIVRNLGQRFRDYRMRMRLTRREVSEASGIGMTTLYKFESGKMTDISLRTIVQLLRVIGLSDNWEAIIPLLPESPYLYDAKGQKAQRIRHSKHEKKE